MSKYYIRADEIKVGDEFTVTVMGGSESRIITDIEKLPNGRFAITSKWNAFMPVEDLRTDIFEPQYIFRHYRS